VQFCSAGAVWLEWGWVRQGCKENGRAMQTAALRAADAAMGGAAGASRTTCAPAIASMRCMIVAAGQGRRHTCHGELVAALFSSPGFLLLLLRGTPAGETSPFVLAPCRLHHLVSIHAHPQGSMHEASLLAGLGRWVAHKRQDSCFVRHASSAAGPEKQGQCSDQRGRLLANVSCMPVPQIELACDSLRSLQTQHGRGFLAWVATPAWAAPMHPALSVDLV
jgi:hypothetical protein